MKETPKQAVALRYRQGEDPAPVVLAKGKGLVAEAIMQLALQSKVPIVKEEALVKFLEPTEVGQTVPAEAYHLAAEVIAFVWKLDRQMKNKRL